MNTTASIDHPHSGEAAVRGMAPLSNPAATGAEPAAAPARIAPQREAAKEKGPSGFVPVALLAVSMLLWFGFQTWQLYGERVQLQQALVGQEQLVQNSLKVRNQLDQLARQTQILADKGNANAQLLVDQLKKRGITINPDATPTGAQPSASAAGK